MKEAFFGERVTMQDKLFFVQMSFENHAKTKAKTGLKNLHSRWEFGTVTFCYTQLERKYANKFRAVKTSILLLSQYYCVE